MYCKIVRFALEFLETNLDDVDVQANFAQLLGIVEDESEYNGGKYKYMRDVIKDVKRTYIL